jgi:hypothetical protein
MSCRLVEITGNWYFQVSSRSYPKKSIADFSETLTAGFHPQELQSFCTKIFSASLTNLTALLLWSHDYSYYVSRPIPAPTALWLQKHTDLRAHDFAHSPDLRLRARLSDFTCAYTWGLRGINTAMPIYQTTRQNALRGSNLESTTMRTINVLSPTTPEN